jgi:hypothetical protein
MDLGTLIQLLEEAVPRIVVTAGRVFLDRNNIGEHHMSELVAKYDSVVDAQYWVNMVPIDDYIDSVASDWDMNDPAIGQLHKLFERSWLSLAASCGIEVSSLSVECLKDFESGDIVFQLVQHT